MFAKSIVLLLFTILFLQQFIKTEAQVTGGLPNFQAGNFRNFTAGEGHEEGQGGPGRHEGFGGHGGFGGQKRFGKDRTPRPFDSLIKLLSPEQRQAFFEVLKNANLTKAEMENQLNSWAQSQSAEIQAALTTAVSNLKTNIKQFSANISASLANNPEALAAFNQLQAIHNNTALNRQQECEQVIEASNGFSAAVREALHLPPPPAVNGQTPAQLCASHVFGRHFGGKNKSGSAANPSDSSSGDSDTAGA